METIEQKIKQSQINNGCEYKDCKCEKCLLSDECDAKEIGFLEIIGSY